MREIPVVKADKLSQEDVDRLRLLDNKLNESEWDIDLLLEDVPTLDFSDFDIDWELPELDDTTTEDVIEDEPPELPEVAKALLGDIYEIGGGCIVLYAVILLILKLYSDLWMELKQTSYLLTHLITWIMLARRRMR